MQGDRRSQTRITINSYRSADAGGGGGVVVVEIETV